jgi:hypothetical protein
LVLPLHSACANNARGGEYGGRNMGWFAVLFGYIDEIVFFDE